jgi:UDP-glucose 4-epimerase
VWCAGTGVPATPKDALDAEHRVLGHLLDVLAQRLDDNGHNRHSGDAIGREGVVFLASSAGAVYAGSSPAPYDEHTEPMPLAYYGTSKLAQEDLVRRFSDRTGVPSLIARISNIYGPGQDLKKPQGIISQLCRADLTGQPTSIYVSMDTIRDYLFVSDCAAKIVTGLDLIRTGVLPGRSTTKVMASQQGVTLGAVLGECRRVFRRPPRVILGTSPLAAVQARDLRMRSVVGTQIDDATLTTLGAGLRATSADLYRALQVGQLPRR